MSNSSFKQKRVTKRTNSFVFFSDSLSSNPSSLCAKLHWRRSLSNLFLTLTDLEDKVIATFSLGQFSRNRNRKVKLSPVSSEIMYQKLGKVLVKYSINTITLFLRTRAQRPMLNALIHSLFSYGVLLSSIEDRRLCGHGFMRLPKRARR